MFGWEYIVFTMKTRIKKIRVERGFTQSGLAERLGVTKQAVSLWENGGSIKADLLLSVAVVLGCSVDQILVKEENHAQSDLA